MPQSTSPPGQWAVVLFAIIPALPILIVLAISGSLLNSSFVTRNMGITGGEASAFDVGSWKDSLDSAKGAADKAKDKIVSCNDKCVKDAFGTVTDELTNNRDDLSQKTIDLLDGTRAVAIMSAEDRSALQKRLIETKSALAKTQTSLEGCEGETCPPSELSTAITNLNSTLDTVDEALAERAAAAASQPSSIMAAVNATIIVIIVAGGAAIWINWYLLPSSARGLKLKNAAALRFLAIAASVLIFVIVTQRWIPSLAFNPSRSAVNRAIFDQTIEIGMDPASYNDLLFWTDFAIGLVAAALSAAFFTSAIVAWTYKGKEENNATVTERTAVVRNVLLVAALVSLSALLLVHSEFLAAQSFLAKTLGGVDNPTWKMVDGIGGALLQTYGIALGLGLAVAYLPAVSYLHPYYEKEKLAASANGTSESTHFPFLRSEIFSMILRFLAILAPAALGTILGAASAG